MIFWIKTLLVSLLRWIIGSFFLFFKKKPAIGLFLIEFVKKIKNCFDYIEIINDFQKLILTTYIFDV